MKSGIYLITSIVNGKKYVGSSVDLKKRKYEHFRLLNKGEHKNILLQNHFNKHGDVFKFSVLEYCKKEDLIKREQYYIDNINPVFNICKIAASILGIKRSEEFIDRMRKDRTGRKASKETKRKMKESMLGKKHSDETRKLIAKIRTGTKRSEATKKKLRDAWLIRKERGPFSEETRKKIGESHRGEKHSLTSLTNDQVSEIKQLTNEGVSSEEIVNIYNINYPVVSNIRAERNWAFIEPKIISRAKPIVKLKKYEVLGIIKMLNDGIRQYKIAELYNINQSCVSNIKNGILHKNISMNHLKI